MRRSRCLCLAALIGCTATIDVGEETPGDEMRVDGDDIRVDGDDIRVDGDDIRVDGGGDPWVGDGSAGDPRAGDEPNGDPRGPETEPGDGPLAGDAPAGASEFLLFDGTDRQFTYADNGFHVLLSPGDISGNWSSPVDYYQGELHVRYVITGPSDQQPGRLQTCIWTMGNEDGDGRNYFPESCSGQASHTGVGEYFNGSLVPSSWWKLDGVPLDFSHPERFLIRVVLRGTSGCNVTRYNVSNPCWDEWPTFENMVFRVTIVMVGPDDTFSGWENYP